MTSADSPHLVRRMIWTKTEGAEADVLLTREWLVTNGLGGYASGTMAGVLTRRYHGLLIAALPAPLDRTVMLSRLAERVRLPDHTVAVLSGDEHADGALDLAGTEHLREFRLEAGLPVWRYAIGNWVIEKSRLMPHHQNTVHATYRLLAGDAPLRLVLRPCVDFRPHHAPVSEAARGPGQLTAVSDRYEVSMGNMPPLRMQLRDTPGAFTADSRTFPHVFYRVEARRGYDAVSDRWSPGYFRTAWRRGRR